MRFGLAQALSATANGPLALSVLALSNALVFHDVERWGSIVIHFGPALVSWSLTWKSAAVQAAWPGAFGALARQAVACATVRAGAKRTACEQENAAAVAAANAPLALYFTWWLVYGAWLLYTPNPDPNPVSDPDPNPNSDPNSGPDPDLDPDPDPNPNSDPNSDPDPDLDPDPKPGAWLLYVGCTLPERRGCRSSFDDMRPLIAKALAP